MLYLSLYCANNENKQKEAGFGRFKNNFEQVVHKKSNQYYVRNVKIK